MRPFAAVAVALTLCVSVCWRFYCSTQHTRTLTHTQSTPVFQWTPSQVPLHSYDEIACGKMCNSRTRPHARPHPHLALSFPYLAATPPSSSPFLPSSHPTFHSSLTFGCHFRLVAKWLISLYALTEASYLPPPLLLLLFFCVCVRRIHFVSSSPHSSSASGLPLFSRRHWNSSLIARAVAVCCSNKMCCILWGT